MSASSTSAPATLNVRRLVEGESDEGRSANLVGVFGSLAALWSRSNEPVSGAVPLRLLNVQGVLEFRY